jgi:hypothetical protein
MAFALRAQGDIDQTEMLKAADWPGYQKIIERMKAERAQEEAKAVAAAQMAAAPQAPTRATAMPEREMFGPEEIQSPAAVGAAETLPA